MNIVVHHNPDCGTSRNVLAILDAAGYKPTVVQYLKTGWTRPQLLGLFAAAGLTPREALRVRPHGCPRDTVFHKHKRKPAEQGPAGGAREH